MDLVSLRYFAETARQRSISKAAVVLGVVQPALTRRIQLLEERVGVPLLMRHRRGVEATEAGQLVLERASVILRMTEQLEEEVRFHGAEPAGQIALGFPPSVGNLFVGKLLSDCIARFPRMKLQLQEDYSPAVQSSLLSGRIDLGIMSCEAQHPDIVLRPLFKESMWLVGRAQDWRFARNGVQPTALDNLPILVGSFMGRLLERNLTRTAVRLNIVAELDSLAIARGALRAGAGYLVVPYSALDLEMQANEFVGAPLKGLEVTRGLFHHRDRPMTRAASVIARMVEEEVAQLCSSQPNRFFPLKGGGSRRAAAR